MNVNPLNLENKVALVTGAATGIGASCVEYLARMGAKVMATDIQTELGQQSVDGLREQGLDVAFHTLDVCSENDWDKSVKATLAQFGGLDILVNNAGIYIGGTLLENSLEQVRHVHKVNVESIFLGMKSAAEVMKPGGAAGKGGSIINLSSIAGLIGVPGHSAYGSTKGAVRLYTKHAAVEFGKLGYGIRVNSVHPGVIRTDMGAQAFQDFVDIGLAKTTAEAEELIIGMTPIGKLGEVEDIAQMIVFLASDAAGFITGAEFSVDGGMGAQ
ncbi:SDR family NAD(P)-dependent oxidoreductase [Amphritea opalescens]|nr:glucose 1-dehydrogenase [Amphritea opalescens]